MKRNMTRCLDSSRLSRGLPCFVCFAAELSFGTLQVVLEGMGRSLHTNYNIKFNCEVLKVSYHSKTYMFLVQFQFFSFNRNRFSLSEWTHSTNVFCMDVRSLQ